MKELFTAVTVKRTIFCRMAFIRTDVSEELVASIIREERISELGTLAVTSN
jgi:hypothetical protein